MFPITPFPRSLVAGQGQGGDHTERDDDQGGRRRDAQGEDDDLQLFGGRQGLLAPSTR